MEIKANRWQKCHDALRRRLRNVFQPGQPVLTVPEPPAAPSAPRLSPLDRIREYLLFHGLAQRVQVSLETAGTGFVLEDADGRVHASDYENAVALIERMWLYQPGALPH